MNNHHLLSNIAIACFVFTFILGFGLTQPTLTGLAVSEGVEQSTTKNILYLVTISSLIGCLMVLSLRRKLAVTGLAAIVGAGSFMAGTPVGKHMNQADMASKINRVNHDIPVDATVYGKLGQIDVAVKNYNGGFKEIEFEDGQVLVLKADKSGKTHTVKEGSKEYASFKEMANNFNVRAQRETIHTNDSVAYTNNDGSRTVVAHPYKAVKGEEQISIVYHFQKRDNKEPIPSKRIIVEPSSKEYKEAVKVAERTEKYFSKQK